MMTIETVKKAERLIAERQRIAAAKWNAIVDDPSLRPESGWRGGSTIRMKIGEPEGADQPLQWAIEEFRKRLLDAIDAELRQLGVDPTAQECKI